MSSRKMLKVEFTVPYEQPVYRYEDDFLSAPRDEVAWLVPESAITSTFTERDWEEGTPLFHATLRGYEYIVKSGPWTVLSGDHTVESYVVEYVEVPYGSELIGTTTFMPKSLLTESAP